MKNALFTSSILVSICFHAGIFALISLPQSPLKPQQPKKVIEVAYQQILASKNIPVQSRKDSGQDESQKARLPDLQTLAKKWNNFDKKLNLTRKEIFKDKITMGDDSKKKIVSMPNIPGEIFKSPEHKDYYYLIREKIRKRVYSHFNKLEKGEVVLTFSLSRDGSLIELSVNNQRSLGSIYLRSIASRSVREAAPFPAFPKALQGNDRLSFTVTFKFEYR
ncbi:MAG: energy transducer TonB [Candidatus Paceibacterota bacterium]|jgi:TonB family protein